MQYKPTFVDFILLLTVSLLWGSGFMFIEIALKTFGPLSIAASRIVLGGLFLYLIMWIKGERFPTDKKTLKILTLMGLAGSTPFILISWAQQSIDSSTAAIAMAVAPLIILILAHFYTDDEKLSLAKILGLGLGFGGVYLLFGGVLLQELTSQNMSLFAMLIAAFFYAVCNILIRKLDNVSALITAAGFLVISSFVIIPLALIFDPPWQNELTTEGVIALLFLGVFSSGLSSLLLILLIKRAGVTFASMTNYFVPLVAVFWGVFLLEEQIRSNSWLAMGLILSGVAIANFAIRGNRP